jgi:hypothetical protein
MLAWQGRLIGPIGAGSVFNVGFPARVFYRQCLPAAVADSQHTGCVSGIIYRQGVKPVSIVALFLLPATGLSRDRYNIHRFFWNFSD